MLCYPARFEAGSEGRYIVTFRDLPQSNTQGRSLDEACANAADALLDTVEAMIDAHQLPPRPSPAEPGERLVPLPATIALIIATMREPTAVGVGAPARQGIRPRSGGR